MVFKPIDNGHPADVARARQQKALFLFVPSSHCRGKGYSPVPLNVPVIAPAWPEEPR